MQIMKMDINQNSLLDIMKDRKAVRYYNPNKKIPQHILNDIFAVATRAPSAWNLQHWKFITIDCNENKHKIKAIAYDQNQVSDASVVVVVLGDKEAYKNGDYIFNKQVELGYMPKSLRDSYLEMLPKKYEDTEFAERDAIRNASLAAMQIMLAAKAYGIDSCPMIGFKEAELIKLLNIPNRYIPVMLITLGYGTREPHPTVRMPLSDIIIKEGFQV